MKNTPLLLLAISLFSVSVMGIGCVDRGAQATAKQTGEIVSDPSTTVQLADVETRPMRETVEITGQISSGDESLIGAKNSGRLLTVNVQDGSRVEAGQVLAVQDAAQLQAQLQQAYAQVAAAQANLASSLKTLMVNPQRTSAAVAQAQAQVRQARAALQKAVNGSRQQEKLQAQANVESAKQNLATQQKELDRVVKLVAEGAIAQNRLDQQQNATASAKAVYDSAVQTLSLLNEGSRKEDLDSARANVQQAEQALKTAQANKELDGTFQDQVNAYRAQVASAQANVRVIQQQIDDATIRAPFSGTISGRPAQAGTVLGPGATLARLVSGDGYYFEGQVPEQLVGKLLPGATVQIKVDAVNYTSVGTVISVNPLGSSISRQFSTRISLSNPPAGLKPGMFGRGEVVLQNVPNATVVPVASVVKRNGKQVVFTVDSGVAKSNEVKLGIELAGFVQVTGITPGTKIVVKGQESLDDGSKVKEGKDKPAEGSAG